MTKPSTSRRALLATMAAGPVVGFPVVAQGFNGGALAEAIAAHERVLSAALAAYRAEDEAAEAFEAAVEDIGTLRYNGELLCSMGKLERLRCLPGNKDAHIEPRRRPLPPALLARCLELLHGTEHVHTDRYSTAWLVLAARLPAYEDALANTRLAELQEESHAASVQEDAAREALVSLPCQDNAQLAAKLRYLFRLYRDNSTEGEHSERYNAALLGALAAHFTGDASLWFEPKPEPV